MKKFLQRYYKQLHFNSMPEAVQDRFYEWVKNGTLTADMQHWANDYLRHDAQGNLVVINGMYVPNNLPHPNNDQDLTEDDAKKLFIAFHKAFSGMNADLSKLERNNPQAAEFVKSYFGVNKLFEPAVATTDCINGINDLADYVSGNTDLKNHIILNLKIDGNSAFSSQKDLDDFLKDCKDNHKYNTDNSVKNKVIELARFLKDLQWEGKIQNLPGTIDNVLSADAFSLSPDNIDQTKLEEFRQVWAPKVYDSDERPPRRLGLLQTLYHNKTIREEFAKHDTDKITKYIGEAEEEVNWQDKNKENYVDPKISDVLTPMQQLQKWATDTYNDTFKKYEELRGGAMFFKQEAKYIFDAIDKNKIKPTDGLKALLDKSGDIEAKINNPVARQHFKWFVEVMGPIKDKMPKAIEGAWNNSTQMKAIIRRIILEATKPGAEQGAVEKAKTAMEIMTAMKYGMMTSKIMDAMRQTDFTIFSDKDLSWNKNDGIKFVTAAFDKSIKTAFLGIGYGVTFARNKIMMSGRRASFTNKDNQGNGELAKAFQSGNINQRNNMMVENAKDAADRTNIQNNLNTFGPAYNATGAITQRKADRLAAESRMNTAKNRMDTNKAGYDAWEKADKLLNTHSTLTADKTTKTTKKTALETAKTAKEAELNNPATYPGPAAVDAIKAQQIQAEIDNLQQQIDAKDEEIADIDNQLAEIDPTELANASNVKTTNSAAHLSYTTAEADYNTHKATYDDLNNKITQFEEGREKIQELTDAINARQHALNNWPEENGNKILELENYWNWLQTGATKTYRFSTKKAQKKFDLTKQQQFRDFVSQHGLDI